MKYIILSVLIVMLFSCSGVNKTSSLNELKVDIKRQEVAVKDLFDRLEVIPLETTDSNLMIWPDKILLQEGKIHIFDMKHPALFVYSDTGKFLCKMGKKGDGPGEYREVYDSEIDSKTGNVQLLSPFGSIFVYNQSGDFIEQITLPERLNYQAFKDVGDSWITWTSAQDEEFGISVISKSTKELSKGFWKQNKNLNTLYPRSFYKYDNRNFFFRPFNREVYEIGKDSLSVVYRWDFQEDNYDIEEKGISRKHSKGVEEDDLIFKYLKNSTIPYIITMQAQTNKYYYAWLAFDFSPDNKRHVFYRKSDGKSFVFQKTSEDIDINPLLFTDEYMLCLVSDIDIEKYKEILRTSEYDKLAKRSEEENPYIIKYYFK